MMNKNKLKGKFLEGSSNSFKPKGKFLMNLSKRFPNQNIPDETVGVF